MIEIKEKEKKIFKTEKLGRNQYQLFKEVINLSYAKSWDEAKKEWRQKEIIQIPKEEEARTCLCGHHPIREVIVLNNFVTKHLIQVGNCCIIKFFEIKDYSKVFNALKKNKINKLMIEMAMEKNWINDWEYNFLKDVWRKRKLSEKQKIKVTMLKERLLRKFKEDKLDIKEK